MQGLLQTVVGSAESAVAEGMRAVSEGMQTAAHAVRESIPQVDHTIDTVAEEAADQIHAPDATRLPMTEPPQAVPPGKPEIPAPSSPATDKPKPDEPPADSTPAVKPPVDAPPGRHSEPVAPVRSVIETEGPSVHQVGFHYKPDGSVVFSQTDVDTVDTVTKDAKGVVSAERATVEHLVDEVFHPDGTREVDSTDRMTSDRAVETSNGTIIEHTTNQTVRNEDHDGHGHAKAHEHTDTAVTIETYDQQGRVTGSSGVEHHEGESPVGDWGGVSGSASGQADWGDVRTSTQLPSTASDAGADQDNPYD